MTDPQRSRDPLVVVKRAPFNAETPPWALEQTPTPTDNFYVRSHFPVPSIAPEAPGSSPPARRSGLPAC